MVFSIYLKKIKNNIQKLYFSNCIYIGILKLTILSIVFLKNILNNHFDDIGCY